MVDIYKTNTEKEKDLQGELGRDTDKKYSGVGALKVQGAELASIYIYIT